VLKPSEPLARRLSSKLIDPATNNARKLAKKTTENKIITTTK